MSAPALPRTVSVIIGTRNRPDTLREALASIRALEGPDLTFEILVGDNGATPETAQVVAEFGGVHDTTETYGCPAARNLAMKRMSGEFVAFLDDDDVWTPENIRPQIALLDARPELAAVFGQVVVADSNLQSPGEATPRDWPKNDDIYVRMLSGYFPQVGANVVRGDIARHYGLMDESLIGDSDWDWNLRIAKEHKIGFVPVPGVICRARPNGTYDKLQTTRVGFTRRIFMRHAKGTLSRWKTPFHIVKSYYGSVGGYCEYFIDAAIRRSEVSDRAGARSALWNAVKTHPFRAMKAIVRRPNLRTALFVGYFGHRPSGGDPKHKVRA
jgi:glycosyltransferase involved in cell wall biosynthesis